ncbi:hypothetical protein [Stigmatella hybrida]|uniref:hypothetical protein n=1 Tax=Stigmatella hybrida TaxID=394097 RepID=UPI001CDAC179|nr:hypothetical protein [Stigmatella hybrida]
MRSIKLTVGNTILGKAKTWAYPDGQHLGIYTIPTYELLVSGTEPGGKKVSHSFEVLRFGIQFKKGFSSPKVVGLSDKQTHTLKAWLPTYSVHSARSVEKGAWHVYDNFLIHDGPDNPSGEVYASIGCIEICNGPQGFDRFNDLLISLSGPTARTKPEQLLEIGSARKISIDYQQAPRPPLTR